MSSFETFLNSFDPIKKGIQFELFVKWFLKNDPEWITQVDEVWMWDEYPDRWGPDCGVDLVFKHKNGETWAVQAKCYDAKYSITKKDVDTFLSESNRNGIDKRLLIASTDRVAKNARQVCQAQEKPVILYLYADFDKAAIDYPSDISQLNSAKRKELPKPRPHQTKAIEDVVQGFESDDRGQMIMACGTGKTYTTLWVKEALDAKTTLVLLPSLSLLSQTLWEWTFASNTPFEVLCVCSDETVGKKTNADEWISSVQDVAFPTTSDPQTIKEFLGRDVSKVIFSTYHSSPLIAEAQSDSNYQAFDLIIADEAHRCTGEAGKAFTTVLDSSLIKTKKRLFATATPKTYSTNLKKKASERGVDIADMSDENSFGKVFHNLTFGQAIDKDLLTDYRVVIIGVDEPMISKWIERRELVKTDTGETTDAKTLASQIGLIKAIKDYDLKRMISFHTKVRSAEWFADDLHNAMDFINDEHRPEGEIYSDFVSGKMPSDKRKAKLLQLKKLSRVDRGLLTNARCLSEGIDVPSLDGVAFIDPRSSQIDIVQSVGRAIRKSDNKTTGTIVLPVFIEEVDDAEKSILSSNFKPIWDVLNALKSHDETLSFELNQLRTNLGRQSGGSAGSLPDKIVFDLPTTVDSSFADSLKTVLIEKTTTSWNFWFGLFEDYIKDKNTTLIPRNYIKNGHALGNWVGAQRQRYRQNTVPQERIDKLNSIDFIWDELEQKWNIGYEYLVKYIEENQHSIVKQGSKYKGYTLSNWCTKQRYDYMHNKLTQERLHRLDDVGFVWNIDDYMWNKQYNNLQKYVMNNGNAMVPFDNITTRQPLGKWTGHQRTARINNKLSSERIKKLDDLDFIWNLQEAINTEQWDAKCTALEKYVKENGDAYVSHRHVTGDGITLGLWTYGQRQLMTNNKLSSEQIQRLDELGFIWDITDYEWDKIYSLIKEHVIEHENYNFVGADNDKLVSWIYRQRSKKDKLSKERIEKLEALEGWVWRAR